MFKESVKTWGVINGPMPRYLNGPTCKPIHESRWIKMVFYTLFSFLREGRWETGPSTIMETTN